MCVGQISVGHGSIEPHVGDGRAGAFRAGAVWAVARVVFPTMAGPLAGPVLGRGVVAVLAPCPWSRLARVRPLIRRRVRARRPGRRRVADLRAARGRVLLGQRAVFLRGLLLPLPDGTQEVIGDVLRVGCGLVDLLRVLVERLEPALHVRRAAAAVVADADPLTGHHRGHFRPEFFAGVLDAAEIPDAVLEGVAVHPGGVAGGVSEFV